jgi:hypothetical protein
MKSDGQSIENYRYLSGALLAEVIQLKKITGNASCLDTEFIAVQRVQSRRGQWRRASSDINDTIECESNIRHVL